MKPQQPEDEWQFLPNDDEWEDESKVVAPEAGALHIERGRRPAAEDPGRSEVDLGEAAPVAAPASYFEDEQPEEAPPATAADEEETDLETILEGQHYAFEPEPD